MYSERFSLEIRLTHHAAKRMRERDVSENILLDLIESGELRNKDATHFWIFKTYPERNDNLLCIAGVFESVLVIKTIMHHFTWEPET